VSPEEVPIPALLRAARGVYGLVIRRRLDAAEFDDLPRNGPFVLGGMVHGEPLAGLLRRLGIGRQAAAELVDTLVARGYLDRRPDPDDRSRMIVAPTERGRAATVEVGAAIGEIDARLAERLGPAGFEGLRAGLVAMTAIREELEAAG